jgi:hypothetical protein
MEEDEHGNYHCKDCLAVDDNDVEEAE